MCICIHSYYLRFFQLEEFTLANVTLTHEFCATTPTHCISRWKPPRSNSGYASEQDRTTNQISTVFTHPRIGVLDVLDLVYQVNALVQFVWIEIMLVIIKVII